MIKFRPLARTQPGLQVRTEGLKRWFQLVQPLHKRLIRRQQGEIFAPIITDEFVHLFLAEPLVQVTKPINRHEFRIGDPARLLIVAGALQTRTAPFIVEFAGKHIELNELEYGFHTTILLI